MSFVTLTAKKMSLTLEVGYVYVMTNDHIPNLLKIGMTTRSPYERSAELSSTGVPGRWIVKYSMFVPNCEKVEKTVHWALREYRLSHDREFFTVNESDAIAAIELHAQPLIDQFPDWPDLEKTNLFIQEELAKIRDENSRRIHQIRLEKQARIVELEIQNKVRIAKIKQDAIDFKRQQLDLIDANTRKDIQQSYMGWGSLWAATFFVISAIHPNRRATIFCFWVGFLMLIFSIHSTWSDKRSAVLLRKQKGLPEI